MKSLGVSAATLPPTPFPMKTEHALDALPAVKPATTTLASWSALLAIQPMDITKLGQLAVTPTQTASPTISNVMGAQTSSLAAQAAP